MAGFRKAVFLKSLTLCVLGFLLDFGLYWFLPARCYASAVFATATCLSFCPSHAGIVPSRAKAGSWNVHHL